MVYEYYGHNDYRDYHLSHHGVLGMKWGIRRYQPYGSGGYNPENKGKFVGETNSLSASKYTDSQRKFAKKEILGSNPTIPKDLINKIIIPDDDLDKWLDAHMELRKLEKESRKEYKKNGFTDRGNELDRQADDAWQRAMFAIDEIYQKHVERPVVEDAVRKHFGIKDVSGLSDETVNEYYRALSDKANYENHPNDYTDPEARLKNIDRDLRHVNEKAASEIVIEELSKTWVDIDKKIGINEYEAEDYLKERSAIETAIESLGSNKKVKDLEDLLRSRSYEFAKDNWDRQEELKEFEFEEKLPEVTKMLDKNSKDHPMTKKQYENVMDEISSVYISEKDINEYRKNRDESEKAEIEASRLFDEHIEKHEDLKDLYSKWDGDGTEFYNKAMSLHPDKKIEEVSDRMWSFTKKADDIRNKLYRDISDGIGKENRRVFYKNGLRSKKETVLAWDIVNRAIDKQDRQAYNNGDHVQIERVKARAKSLARGGYYSQAEIAKMLGISPSTVSEYIDE